MQVKVLKPFTTADLKLSPGVGYILELEDEMAQKLIDDGLAEKVESLIPAGTLNIAKNSTVDVSKYKTVKVQVNTWATTFDANNEQNEATNIIVANGDSIVEADLENLHFTVPEGKKLAGWSNNKEAENPDIVFPYTPTGDGVLYAVWVDNEE